MTFADRLREAMEMRGLTQGQLSIKTGLSQSFISRVLANENSPAVDRASKIARALDVSLDWLCGLPPRTPNTLTPDELDVLASYRRLNSASKGVVRRMVRDMAENELSGGQ